MIKMKEFNKGLRRLAFLSVLIVLTYCDAKAQYDPMFSQYMNNEMFINPAYAGSRDYISTFALYRNQWVGIDGAPITQTFTVHAPLKTKKIGLGLSFMNEEIGVTKKFSVLGTYAYRLPVSEDGILSFGLQGGLTSLQENLSKLSPVDGVNIDPLFMMDTPTKIAPKAGFGLYYTKPNYYVGWSIPRLIESSIDPTNNFEVNNEVNLENWHNFITLGYIFPVSDNIKLKPTIMTKAVYGAPVEWDLNINALINELIWIGASYRTGDAIALISTLNVTPQFRVGYSYDYTLTEIGDHTSGSHEISIGYDFNFKKAGISSIRYF